MRISDSGLKFIEQNEGFSSTVYEDNGHQAIGYGHDLQPGESFPNGITQEDAEQLLMLDVANRFEPVVNGEAPADCTQNQFDALCDFAYNLGAAALRQMVAHGWSEVSSQMLRWNHVNGAVNEGLTIRRQKEVELFMKN